MNTYNFKLENCIVISYPRNEDCVNLFIHRFFNSNGGWKITVAVFSFLLAILIVCMLLFYGGEMRLQGIFLNYGKLFLHDWTSVYAYIPLFMLLLAGMIALFMFQHLAYSSRGVANSDFWNFANPGFLGVLNILEFIW